MVSAQMREISNERRRELRGQGLTEFQAESESALLSVTSRPTEQLAAATAKNAEEEWRRRNSFADRESSRDRRKDPPTVS